MTILCTIDLETREVSIPSGQCIAAYDHNVDVIHFQAEPIEDFSLDTSTIRIAAQGPNKSRHDYAVDPSTVAIEEETGYITFDWPIPAGVTEMPLDVFKYGDKGQLIFAVCAEIISGNAVSKAWHSDDGIITVVAHLEPEAGGGEDPEEEATNRQMIGQLQTDVAVIRTQVGALTNGSPAPVETVAEMTDESAVYLYTGSETGYTAGNWYFWNGSAWTSGGTYGGAVTDTTLSVSGAPADAKSVGEALAEKADSSDVTALDTRVTVVEDNVEDVKEDLNRYQENTFRSPISYIITSNTWWTIGEGVNPTTGTDMVNAKYARTNYIRFSKPTLLYFDDSNYDFIVWEYSAQSVNNAEFAPRGYYGDKPVIISIEQGVTDFRVGVKRKDNANITSEDISAIIVSIKTYTLTDTTLTLPGVPADAKATRDEIGALKEDLANYNSPYFNWTKKFPTATYTSNGVTFTYVSEGVYDISGTATDKTFRNLVTDKPVEEGDIYTFSLSGGVPIRIYVDKSDGSSESINFTKDGEYSLLMPSDAVDITVRWQISSGSVYTPTVRATLKMNKRNPTMESALFPTGDNTDRTAEIERVLSKYGKCNFQKGRYYVRNVKMPNNSKVEGVGTASEIVLLDGIENLWPFPSNQTFTKYKEFDLTLPAGRYTFKADVSSTDTDTSVSCVCFYYQEPFESTNAHYTNIARGTGKTITLDAEQPIIHLELLSSDTFTHSTGDTGTFSNISLYTERTAAFVLGDECCVQNLKLMGDLNAVIHNADGFRDGVLYTGLGSNTTIHKGIISGCFMTNFTGGCITLIKTGYSSSGGLNISDCYLTNSYAGINIPLWSEFHRISNCSCTGNKYGAVNNGGNNEFVGCNFSSNTYGFVMDNSDLKLINNTHGGVSGCILQHNTARAIYANRVNLGFIFEGCNIDNGGVELDHVTRIIFNSCNFMDEFTLTINGIYASDNGIILFSSSLFADNFTGNVVSISDISKPYVKFNNCYMQNGSIVNPAS